MGVPVPKAMVQEVVKQVPVPQVQTVEKIVEVPQVQTVEKVIEVPQVQVMEKVVPVPQTVVQEVVRQVPRVIADDDHGSTNDDYGRACSGHQLRPPTNDFVGKRQAALKPAVRTFEH